MFPLHTPAAMVLYCPLPTGLHNVHVQQSNGPDTNLMKFYSTTNSTTHGRNWENFEPHKGKPYGTGYISNLRPAVYYSKEIDNLDNHKMMAICNRNYLSVTHRDFTPYHDHRGSELLPLELHKVPTGFVRETALSVPKYKDVQKTFINTRVTSAPADILPCHRPLLHNIQPKNPIEAENAGYGPSSYSTETKQKFRNGQGGAGDVCRLSVGPGELSGFTHNLTIEPITFHPNQAHKNDLPGWMTDRPTEVTVTKTSFTSYQDPRGEEPLPVLAIRSERGSGNTHDHMKQLYTNPSPVDAYLDPNKRPKFVLDKLKKADPTDYLNVLHQNNHRSVYPDQYHGKQRPDATECDRLNSMDVGNKERTGYVANNYKYSWKPDDVQRFITHYSTRFKDNTPKGVKQEGHCRGSVQTPHSDGFTLNTSVHSMGPDIYATATLRQLDPYIARSISARDTYFDDHLYDRKLHCAKTIAT